MDLFNFFYSKTTPIDETVMIYKFATIYIAYFYAYSTPTIRFIGIISVFFILSLHYNYIQS